MWQCCARHCNDDTVITAMLAVVCVVVCVYVTICNVFQMLASRLEPGLVSMSMEMVHLMMMMEIEMVQSDDDGNDD